MEDMKPNCGSNVQHGLQPAIDDVASYSPVLVRLVHFKVSSFLTIPLIPPS